MKKAIRTGVRTDVVLAGDIGGTNTRLGLFRVTGSAVKIIASQVYQSKQYPGLDAIVRDFMNNRDRVAAACFGIAGPVLHGAATATNLPWHVSEQALRKTLSMTNVALINDLVANAHGLGVMKGRDYVILNQGRKNMGNAAILSAGTGLGAAILFWDGTRHVPLPSEGGHVEFGPRNRLELELLNYLFGRFGHVSYERILSGAGIYNIYRFLRNSHRFGKEPAWLMKQLEESDPAAVINEAARLHKNRLCAETMDLFASIYGAAAGSFALQVMARAGIYIGGGIAPKLVWKLKDGTFMKAFKDKGRLAGIVAPITVRVIMQEQAALLGAAVRAAALRKNC